MRLSRWSPGCGSPCAMSDSPSRLFSCTSKPGSQAPAPTPSECVSTQARPCASTATMFVVCSPASGTGSNARTSASTRSVASAPGELREPREELGNAAETAAGRDAPPGVLDEHGVAPERAIAREIVGREHDAVHAEERLGERAAVHARSALLGERLERLHEAGLVQDVAFSEQASVPREELATAPERVELAEHVERARVHLGKRHAGAGERQRRLAEPRPRKAAEPFPQLAERPRQPGHGARRGADGVDDQLVAERDRELLDVSDCRTARLRTRPGS